MKQQWNPQLYNDKHAFVYDYGASLVELLNPQKHERILDLGCGSGQLTASIQKSAKEVIGIDKSPAMIQDAKAKFADINFQVADAADFHFEEKFDAIFSNATLHWVLEVEKAIDCMYQNLNPNGRIVVEFGGKDNIKHLFQALRNALRKRGYIENAAINPWYYPSIATYATKLEKAGFRVVRAEHYDRWTPLVGETGLRDWYVMFTKIFFKGISEVEQAEILQDAQDQLAEKHFKEGVWYADYKRIRIVALKEK